MSETEETVGLPVTLHHAREAYDYEFVAARLHDRHLLDSSIAVRVFRAPLLAVPVGGRRRGGYMSIGLLPLALEVRGLLASRPGFPNPRVNGSDTCHLAVEWGARAPDAWEDDEVFGRFYGYSDAAITQYTAARRPRASTIPRPPARRSRPSGPLPEHVRKETRVPAHEPPASTTVAVDRSVVRSSWRQRPVYDRNDPYRTGPSVVNYDLDQLKVGENWVVVGHKDGYDIHGRDLAPGDGWSRALYAPECCWPSGSELCVCVEWHPDRAFGSDWAARTKAVVSGLRMLGYIVEHAGRPADPAEDLYVTLLVYRMEPGKAPPRRPQDAWAHVPAPRTYTWPEISPREQVQKRLSKIKPCKQGARLAVWAIESALWPPEADFCVQVRWWPAPDTSTESVYSGIQEITALMRDDDLQVRAPERPLPDSVESVDLLVYREVQEPVNSP